MNIQHHSQDLNELFTALAKAQQEMHSAAKNSKGFNYKYADLPTVIECSRPVLTKHGLSVTQLFSHEEDGALYLYTMLGHCSGQWIKSCIKVTVPQNSKQARNEMQDLGSCITYLRRYAYAALVGVVADVDDDAQGLTHYAEAQRTAPNIQR